MTHNITNKALLLVDELMQAHKGHSDEGATTFSEAAEMLLYAAKTIETLLEQQKQPNPVGYMRWENGSAEYVSVKQWEVPFDGDWHTIYTAPQPARQPLTDEQIIEIADKTQTAEPGTDGYILPISFARVIEAAHGIVGTNNAN